MTAEELQKSLRLAYEKIDQLEQQLVIAQRAACVILGLDFERLREQVNGLQERNTSSDADPRDHSVNG